MEYLNKDFCGTCASAALLLDEVGIGAELITVILDGVEDLTTQEYTALRFIRSRLQKLEDRKYD